MMATRTPQALAIAKLEKAERFTPGEVVDAVKCIMRDPDLANAYLALSNPDVAAKLIRSEITKLSGTATRTPQTLAIAKIEKAEGLELDELVSAVECVMRDPDLANAYLALSDPYLGAVFIRREIIKFRSLTQQIAAL